MGFKRAYRPLLFLDGTNLLGKYQGTLLGTTGEDGNIGFFHVTFSIVDNETDGNWTWFILKLGDALYDKVDYEEIITFVSDQSKGLMNSIAKVSIAKEFNDSVNKLQPTSPEAYHWLIHESDMSHWFKMICMLCTRREQVNKWEIYLCPDIYSKVEILVMESRNLHVSRYVNDRYEVIDQYSNSTDTNVYRFISGYFTVNNYKLTYKEAIFHVPDHEKLMDDNQELRLCLLVTRIFLLGHNESHVTRIFLLGHKQCQWSRDGGALIRIWYSLQ
ncbi:uncharacterized protein LOC120268678 [Dioscorea cayenensis subsp. rotundata]|uniref:Uncharacterized protein LOC120268678 n=1 Tax=Dioscorea cayennensis subsp. rotundata TaxID=55577 RepID=A0AB40BWQ9_DIOCR|nr:uncharacterized protein LOC120268678 [Dioscorea cayenensis subsp. rotundata]